MRKWILIMLVALGAVHSCNQSSDGYNIQVDLEGAEGKWVKMMARADGNYVTFDSVLVEAGTTAVMNRTVDGVTTMYLTVGEGGGSVQLLVENADYEITGTLENPVISTSSRAHNDLIAYNDVMKPVEEELTELRTMIMEAQGRGDSNTSDSLINIYYERYDQQDALDSAYVADHPSSYASVLALRSTFYNLDAGQLDAVLSSLDPDLHQMEEYIYMNGKLERMNAVDIGKPYTDFSLATPEGGLQSVSDVHNGNVLLIDFWASWCGPCRRANPELVDIYLTYHESGFDILGVSLDRDSASWVKAIADDNLTWNHISDLKYWDSEGAELYGVSAIPHAVLIDREGKIVAKNLHGDQLRQAIEEHL